ncbi:MAG: dephospho-CoA kinase [Pyrinomonadaceae bacterium]
MLKVGLTGSIAVGKSFVCEVFRKLGAFVIDADKTAREVVAPNTKGLKAIVENFGAEILHASGELDRAKLGAMVFADERKRQLLNSIVHPLVIEKQNDWLRESEAENPKGIAVVDAALMIESGGYKRFDKLIVVWCAAEIQIARLMARNNLNRESANERIKAQMPQAEKKRYADFTIDTTEGFESARRQTIEVFRQLKLLGEKKNETTDLHR